MENQWDRRFMRLAIGLGALAVGVAALIAAASSTVHYQDMGESSLGGDWVMRVNDLTGVVTVCSNQFGCSAPVESDRPAATKGTPGGTGPLFGGGNGR